MDADCRKRVSQQNQHFLKNGLIAGNGFVHFFGSAFREGGEVSEAFDHDIVYFFGKENSSVPVLLVGAVVDVARDNIDCLPKEMVVTLARELVALEGLPDRN